MCVDCPRTFVCNNLNMQGVRVFPGIFASAGLGKGWLSAYPYPSVHRVDIPRIIPRNIASSCTVTGGDQTQVIAVKNEKICNSLLPSTVIPALFRHFTDVTE